MPAPSRAARISGHTAAWAATYSSILFGLTWRTNPTRSTTVSLLFDNQHDELAGPMKSFDAAGLDVRRRARSHDERDGRVACNERRSNASGNGLNDLRRLDHAHVKVRD